MILPLIVSLIYKEKSFIAFAVVILGLLVISSIGTFVSSLDVVRKLFGIL